MIKQILGAILLTLLCATVSAEQTEVEKKAANVNGAERSLDKGVNRLDEATCLEGDAKCAAQKAEHRMEEAGQSIKGKAKETADKIDKNKSANQ